MPHIYYWSMTLQLPIPFPLVSSMSDSWNYDASTGCLQAMASEKTDWYCNPADKFNDEATPTLNALTLLGTPEPRDFQLSAKVTVDFNADFDAGVLAVWVDEKTWAKLCFEYSPDKIGMVVSVVTLGASDDSNAFTLPNNSTFLRVSRFGRTFAFHASRDRSTWELIRVFALNTDINSQRVGFLAQAPTGPGCSVKFSEINFSYSTLNALRDGS